MEPPVRIELTTYRLQGGCSTTELQGRRRRSLREPRDAVGRQRQTSSLALSLQGVGDADVKLCDGTYARHAIEGTCPRERDQGNVIE